MRGVVLATVLAVATLMHMSPAHAGLDRLTATDHGLVRPDGTPFFWLGDTAWKLYRATPDEVDTYLTDRAAKGFTIIQGPVLFGDGANFEGVVNDDPLEPKPAWFQHIDYIIFKAEELGLYVAPVITWGNFLHQFDSPEHAYAIGVWLGFRYAWTSNLVWILGGEFNRVDPPVENADEYWRAFAAGLQQFNDRWLVTAHPRWYPPQSSSAAFPNTPENAWFGFHMIQSGQNGDDDIGGGSDNWNNVLADYNLVPPKPVLDAEGNYERIGGWTPHGVRKRAYWSVFAGAFGHTYGGNGVWQWSQDETDCHGWAGCRPWQEALQYPGASQLIYLRRLMEWRTAPHVPDAELLVNFAPADPPTANHVQVARADNSRYFMAYGPKPDQVVSFDLDRLGVDAVNVWWYDPRTGISTFHERRAAEGILTVTSPNGPTPDDQEDWVLVVDSRIADLDNDGDVDPDDLLKMLDSWGEAGPTDLDGDGSTGPFDLGKLLESWS